jgi:hypothetical protein
MSLDTVDGLGKHFRTNLKVIKSDDRVQLGEYRWIIIDITDNSVLCYGTKPLAGLMFFTPVRWIENFAAQKWIENGCIANIQESFQNLNCGFVREFVRVVS